MAREILRASDERRDRLDIQGAVELAHRAIRADPTLFPAHRQYITLMRLGGATPELRREYASLAARSADPLFECLAISVSYPSGYPQAAYDAFVDLERRYGPSACSTFGRAEAGVRTPARLISAQVVEDWKAAAQRAPDLSGSWHAYAGALRTVGRYDDSEAALRAGLSRARSGADRVVLFTTLADVREQAGDSAGAASLRRALGAAVDRDGRPGVRFHYAGAFLPGMSPSENARRLRAMSRIAAATTGAWPYEWISALTLGTLLSDGGNPAGSLGPLDRSVFLADSVGRSLLSLVAYRQRGRALSKMGRLDEAERDLRHAIDVGESIDESYQLAEAYHNLAHVYEGAGRFDEAEAAVTRFVELTRPMRHAQPRMMSLHDAGIIRWKAGWHATANQAFAEMVRVVDEQERNHYWAGEFLERNGDYRGAIHYYREGARIDALERSLNLGGLVRAYRALGLADSAAAAARAHDAGLMNQLDVPMLPRMLAEQGRTDEAVAEAHDWARRRLDAGNVQGATLATLELGEILLAAGREREAADQADRAAALARRLNLTDELGRALRLGGLARVRSDNPQDGLALLRQAVTLAEAHPTADALLDARLALADGLAADRNPAALAAYDRAAREVERLTGGLDLDTDRARFRERHLAPFDGAIRLVLEQPRGPAAAGRLLDWTRRRKAAALALAGGGFAADPARHTVRPRLGAGEALVDYVVLDDRVAAVVVTPDRARIVTLSVHPDTLRAWAARLRAPLVATYGGRLDLARATFDLELAHRLYRAVLEPLLAATEGAARLTISPDGPLHLVPFEALPIEPAAPGAYVEARYVIDRWEVAFVPSVEFLGDPADAGVGPGAPLLAVTGEAPGADRELAAIERTWGRGAVLALSGASATEEAVAARGSGRAILHFAVHASADDRDPAASHLRLAEGPDSDGWLHAGEIAALDLDARLVVLSGCETVAGPLFAGEGRLGLARAFLASGARAVVATDWPVGATAADVSEGFYRRLSAGEPVASALRGARLDLRRHAATAHPFHWAGYVLLLGG